MTNLRRRLKYRFCNKNKSDKKHKNIWMWILLFTFLFTFVFYRIELRIGALAQEAALSKLNGEITIEVNKSVLKIINEEQIDTTALVRTEIQNQHMHTMVTDYNRINLLKSRLAISVQEKLNNMDRIETVVPIGMIFSDTLMTGWGMNIPVKVFSTNEIIVEFFDDFVSGGINQTKHKLMLRVKVPAKVSGLFCSQTTVVETEVPICETIIVGEIPELVDELN